MNASHTSAITPRTGECGICHWRGFLGIYDHDLQAPVHGDCAFFASVAMDRMEDAGCSPPSVELIRRHQAMRHGPR